MLMCIYMHIYMYTHMYIYIFIALRALGPAFNSMLHCAAVCCSVLQVCFTAMLLGGNGT